MTIPFNDANYFLDGVGIPKDTPQIRNAKIDLKNNLYMKQEHFNGMSQCVHDIKKVDGVSIWVELQKNFL